jgi:hypothetical protein
MYDTKDPRANLSTAAKPTPPTAFAAAEYAKFYETPPQETSLGTRTWYARGQNFIVAYSETAPGAVLAREAESGEYFVILPGNATTAAIVAGTESKAVPGYSLAIVPPGNSSVTLPSGGTAIRIFAVSPDLASKCGNALAYEAHHPNIPPFEAWHAPPDGYRIRSYSLDVPPKEGRFGKIFRCSTLMVNFLPSSDGPRDLSKLSPHHHDDFEQGSLSIAGTWTHHIRWPWTPNFNIWREDEHETCASPSLCVIPPPAVHTSYAAGQGTNTLIDIFAPPRLDFSKVAGWVLNAEEYPMPKG